MDRIRKIFSICLACISLLLVDYCFAQKIVQSSSNGWFDDFVQLKREMETHYANLEWSVAERRMDLKQLSQETESRLRQARSDAEAKQAIESFLKSFGDGHLRVTWPSPHKEQSAGKQSLCSRLGFQQQQLDPGIAFHLLESFQGLNTADSRYFPIGILSLPGGKRVGLLRIALFSEYPFPDLCESATAELRLKKDDPCDESCADRVDCKASDMLTAALERQLQSFGDIDALLVDITGNGGGTDWVEPAARVLTSKKLHSPRIGFIRHEHWAKQLHERLAAIEASETDSHQTSPAQHQLMLQAADTYRKAFSEARLPVQRSMLWENQRPVRSLVVKDLLFTSGTVPYLEPGRLRETAVSEDIFYPSRYIYHEGTYSGPLIILVDGRTASSAEYFASMLADNGAATVMGSPTNGAGSGYTNGGISTVLKNSGGNVKMPDCVRFRADGSNEVAGFAPNLLIPWRQNDSPYQRAKRVLETLTDVITKLKH